MKSLVILMIAAFGIFMMGCDMSAPDDNTISSAPVTSEESEPSAVGVSPESADEKNSLDGTALKKEFPPSPEDYLNAL